jgi:D-alanyl-D-alanine carboxypeptidase/D-alanyl-D-alanine-endopeptidase (penicillin-binding protein 4)
MSSILLLGAGDFYYNYKPKTETKSVFDNQKNNDLENLLKEQVENRDFFIGIDIKDIEGNPIVSINSNKYFRPASLTKLITTYLLVDQYNLDKQFFTYLYLEESPKSTVESDIYIQGKGDPFLTVEEYKNFLKKLKLSGINTIYGDLIFDFSFFEISGYGEGWIWNDPQPQILPLNIWTNNNAISKITTYEEQKDRIKYLTVYLLNELGINFQGEIYEKKVPSDYKPYFTNVSDSLENILEFMNRESDNYISEHLFRYLLTEWEFDSQNSYKDIIEVINNKLYFLNNEIIITDGTGLSTYNLITPSTMNKVIEEIIKKISLEKTKSLLTTSSEKGIFYNRYNESNVWVKTGTLYTDSAIAGILESSNKNYYLFTIIINNSVENIKDIKDFEIELIKTIYYHIK